ncbi:hypothetical protein FHS49_001819 [Sphingobium boeckii]|uniref:Uncharacterized protein n=1 Tax=Sphingobium boeckii TaxID=1082345 RepID=A0A7W9EE13_9SPHN|nr:hypothetical protein [Sphingobium boeckii]
MSFCLPSKKTWGGDTSCPWHKQIKNPADRSAGFFYVSAFAKNYSRLPMKFSRKVNMLTKSR